jgi:AraC family transcriptional regulator
MNSDKIAKENIARLNTAITFIEANLSEKLSLKIIAEKAHFSPYHFHRLFSVAVGETVQNFINRKRIEKAALILLHQKEKTITEISEQTGFSDISSLSRAFKKFYGISPNKFKEESPEKYSKICKTESKKGQIEISFEQYICNINNALNWLKMKTKTEIKQIEKLNLAYIAHQGNMDKIGKVFNRLIQWAAPKGLMSQDNLRMVTIYHDSPKITSPENIRSSIAIVLNSEISVDGEVGLKTIESTKCIVNRLEITQNEFQQAWESSFVWMTENGYKKSEIDPFEIFYNNAAEHPENKFIVDLCIPIL